MKKVLTDLNIDGKILAEGSSEFSLTNSEDNSVTIQQLYDQSRNGVVIQQPDSRRNLTQITTNSGSSSDWTYTASTPCTADMWVVATITGGSDNDFILHRLVAKHSTSSSDAGTVLNSRTVASSYGDSIWAYYRRGEYIQYFRTACSGSVTISYYTSPQLPIEPATIGDGSILFQLSGHNVALDKGNSQTQLAYTANQENGVICNIDLSSSDATTTWTDESGTYSDVPAATDLPTSGWSLSALFARIKKIEASLKKVAFSGEMSSLLNRVEKSWGLTRTITQTNNIDYYTLSTPDAIPNRIIINRAVYVVETNNSVAISSVALNSDMFISKLGDGVSTATFKVRLVDFYI